ncbi:MAG: hypothetical protein ACOC8L_11495 [Spirochaetota bacterium]
MYARQIRATGRVRPLLDEARGAIEQLRSSLTEVEGGAQHVADQVSASFSELDQLISEEGNRS